MSVHRLGVNGTRPLVLLDLGEAEREALARVLALAEEHLGEIPYPELRSRRLLAEAMISELRTAAGLPAVKTLKGQAS
jgi:hypothetical protein